LTVLTILILVFPAVPEAAGTSLSPVWTRTFGTTGVDQGWGVELGPLGEVYLAGIVLGQGNDVFIARLDPAGNTVWENRWRQPYSQKAFEVKYSNGFLYVGGVTQRDFSVESQDMLLLKLASANGTIIWNTTWNGPADLYDEIDGIVVEDGYLYVSGWADVKTDYTAGDIALVKFTQDGDYVTHSIWGGSGREEANGSMASDGSTLYVAGITGGTGLFSGGDAAVVAFSKAILTETWNRTWGGSQVDDGLGLALRDDHLFITGITTSFGGDKIFLLKYEVTGSQLFNVTWGGSGTESARAIGVPPDQTGIYIAGKTSSYGSGGSDIVLLRYNQTGQLDWYRTWGGNGDEASHGIFAASDAVYIAGETASQGQGSADILLMKVGLDGGTAGPTAPPAASNTLAPFVALGLVLGALTLGLFLVRRHQRARRIQSIPIPQ